MSISVRRTSWLLQVWHSLALRRLAFATRMLQRFSRFVSRLRANVSCVLACLLRSSRCAKRSEEAHNPSRPRLSPPRSSHRSHTKQLRLNHRHQSARNLSHSNSGEATSERRTSRRRHLQVHRTSYLETLQRMVKYEGSRCFYKGLPPRIINNGVYSCLIMCAISAVSQFAAIGVCYFQVWLRDCQARERPARV